MINRYSRQQQIEKLNPETNHIQICRLLAGYEFPWDINRSLELAMLKTFCIPSISKLLHQTGEFHHHTQKRYDDTGILIGEILKYGYDSDRGSMALARMNKIHGHYAISNEDFIYVLSTFVFEPINWNLRFGWRKMTNNECLALFYFWYQVGKRMAIKNIPNSYEALKNYYETYQEKYFIYAETNAQVAQSTVDLFLSWFPAILSPLLEPIAMTIFGGKMLRALGKKSPPSMLTNLVISSLKLRGYWQHLLPPKQVPYYFVDSKIRSYPDGYHLKNVGPLSLMSKRNQNNNQ